MRVVRCRLVANKVILGGKQSDISGQLNALTKKIHSLEEQSVKTRRLIKNLDNMFTAASSQERAMLNAVKDRISVYKQAQSELEAVSKIYTQLTDMFGGNTSAKRTITSALSLLARTRDNVSLAEEVVHNIAYDSKPEVLCDKNPVISRLKASINDAIARSVSRPRPRWLDEFYLVDTAGKNGLVFARYFRINNVPTSDGVQRTLYVTAKATLTDTRKTGGRPKCSFSPVSIALLPDPLSPSYIHQGVVCSSVLSVQRALHQQAVAGGLRFF